MEGTKKGPHLSDSGQLPGSLELAFLGDTVYDLYVRSRMLLTNGRMKQLHLAASGMVCAKAQSEALARIEGILTPDELAVVKRGRNAKQSPPKNADPAQYHRATALEALIGRLYLAGDIKRLDQLMEIILSEKDASKE